MGSELTACERTSLLVKVTRPPLGTVTSTGRGPSAVIVIVTSVGPGIVVPPPPQVATMIAPPATTRILAMRFTFRVPLTQKIE